MTSLNNIIKTVVFSLAVAMFLVAAHMASARDEISLPVLNKKIEKGTIIKEYMLGEIQYPAASSTHMVQNKEAILGMETVRNLRPGFPLRMSYFQEPLDVRRGEPVSIIFSKKGIQLLAEGESMQDGRAGDWIYVMNNDSRKRVQAQVQQNGTVVVQ